MNTKLITLLIVVSGALIGAVIGKSLFGLEESLAWAALIETFGEDDYAFEYFFEETTGPIKIGGGAIIGSIFGFILSRLIKRNNTTKELEN